MMNNMKLTEQEEFEIFKGYDDFMVEYDKQNPPPKCHLTHMEYCWDDSEYNPKDWYECKHCGHTKSVKVNRY